jgi:hypothetical protein
MLGMNERFVVLCADSEVSRVCAGLRTPLDGDAAAAMSAQFILGIRAAKGLEFADVIILDFFSALPDVDYRAWKELLDANSGDSGGSQGGLSAYAHPQLEPQLKLLYTAITRCINRLVFVETAKSRVGGVFFRWLQRRELAERCTMLDGADAAGAEAAGQGTGPVLMTTDEWKARGIDLALAATSVASAESTLAAAMFDQAAYCFQRANSPAFCSAANVCAEVVRTRAALASGDQSSSGSQQEVLSSAKEMQFACLISRCLAGGFAQDARDLCMLVRPALSTLSRVYFSYEIAAKLQ